MSLLKKIKNLDKYTKLAIIIIIIGIILRFSLASIYHISGDGCWHFSVAKFIANEGKIPLFEQFGRDEPFWSPPLFHIILAFVYKTSSIFSENIAEFSMKMVSPLFSSLTLIFSYLIMKKLFQKKIALYSLLFLTFIPLSLDYGIFGYIGSTLSFFVVLSVYFMLNNKIKSSAICLGLAILTKYSGIFILPLLIYLIYSNNKKEFFKKTSILISISFLIGLPWFIRNWVYLGNPIWPFFNTLFHATESFVGSFNILNIFSINGLMTLYLGIFGVPNGNINTLFFLKMPGIKLLFAIWLLATIIFTLPLLLGLFSKTSKMVLATIFERAQKYNVFLSKRRTLSAGQIDQQYISDTLKHKKILFVWISGYVLLILLYIASSSWSVARFMLPAFPALALIWGSGLNNIKSKNITKIFIMLIIFIIAGFVFVEAFKVTIAAKAWNSYKDDFEWVKSDTNKQDIFLGYQCISFNLDRFSLPPYTENVRKASYIFVNKKFKLETTSIVNDDILKIIDKNNFKKVYHNNITGTIIYKTKE